MPIFTQELHYRNYLPTCICLFLHRNYKIVTVYYYQIIGTRFKQTYCFSTWTKKNLSNATCLEILKSRIGRKNHYLEILSSKNGRKNHYSQKLCFDRIFALKKWKEKPLLPKNCVLTEFLHERSRIFLPVFSLVRFWIFIRNGLVSLKSIHKILPVVLL